jgi:hypothetical protein
MAIVMEEMKPNEDVATVFTESKRVSEDGKLIVTKTPNKIQPQTEIYDLAVIQAQLDENVKLFTQHWLPNIQRDFDIMFEAQKVSPNKEALEQMIAMFEQFKSQWDERELACQDLLKLV